MPLPKAEQCPSMQLPGAQRFQIKKSSAQFTKVYYVSFYLKTELLPMILKSYIYICI